MAAGKSRGATVFLLVWLALLTGMAALVVHGWATGAPEGEAPPLVWLAIAAGGWVIGVFLLRRSVRARPKPAHPRKYPTHDGQSDGNEGGLD